MKRHSIKKTKEYRYKGKKFRVSYNSSKRMYCSETLGGMGSYGDMTYHTLTKRAAKKHIKNYIKDPIGSIGASPRRKWGAK